MKTFLRVSALLGLGIVLVLGLWATTVFHLLDDGGPPAAVEQPAQEVQQVPELDVQLLGYWTNDRSDTFSLVTVDGIRCIVWEGSSEKGGFSCDWGNGP